MRPSDVVAHRRVLHSHAKARAETPEEAPNSSLLEAAELLAEILPLAELFYVSPDMTAVIRRAADTLPRHGYRDDEIFAPHGFLIWDGAAPITADFADTSTPVRGILWSRTEFHNRPTWHYDDEKLATIWREGDPDPTEEMDRPPDAYMSGIEVEIVPIMEQSGLLMPASGCWYWYEGQPEVVFDDGKGASFRVATSGCGEGDVILATWLLMSQTIARIDRQPAERHERKRSFKASLPSMVTVVRLRRFSDHTDEEDSEPTSWSHRWLVGGHWRNQYHPSSGEHQLQWIDPYVKGPKHLPLIIKERVKALVR